MQDFSFRQSLLVIPPEVGYRLAGFCDGEAHFGIGRVRKPARRRVPITHHCLFAVNLRWDDRAVLEHYREATGLGVIHFNSRGRQRAFGNPLAMWRIERKEECLALVAILEEYPLWSKKLRDFAIWAQAVRYWNGPRREGQEPLARWFAEIRAVRGYESEPFEPYKPQPEAVLFDYESVSETDQSEGDAE